MLTLKAQLLTSSADMKVSLDQGRDAQVKLNWQLNSATVQRLCYKQTASKSGTVNLKPLIYFRTESKKFYKRKKKRCRMPHITDTYLQNYNKNASITQFYTIAD